MGEKREKSNREYSSKVLASKDLHYICRGICVKGQYRWTELQNARIRGGELVLSKTTLLAASILLHVEESRWKVHQVSSHSIIPPGDPPLVALCESDHQVISGTWKGVFY